jgi:tetratricopeptide (TPR) repeat protein
MRMTAEWHTRRGNAALDRGDLDQAGRCFEKATRSDASWSVPWFNLGLVHKRRGEWARCLECNQKAAEKDPADQAAWWNLGISATALSNWGEARRAWSAYGIELPGTEGEIRGDFGLTPIRLHSVGEVVWTNRIDPARAIIRNVPLPDADRRFGDLLLHDGAPNGYRMLRGQEVAVFDELERLASSGLGTFEATINASSALDLKALEETFLDGGGAAEDWSSIRYLCTACSEGRPHEAHDHGEQHAEGERRFGIAAPSFAEASRLLEEWSGAATGRKVSDLETLLEPVSGV